MELFRAVVAAYIGSAYFFTSSTSFANPAITIGRMFSDSFAGIPRTDLDGYATTAYVDDVARSLEVDLNPYATRSYVDVAIDRIADVDLSGYALGAAEGELLPDIFLSGRA